MKRTLYGRRVGKPLRAQQAGLVADLLPQVRLDVTSPLAPASLFPRVSTALWLEIGFGGGEHLVRNALAHPGVGFIGCEPFLNGVAKVLAAIEREDVRNLRLHHGDARDVLAGLPDASLARIDLLYPDPWPKRRQRKRRFVSPQTLTTMARVLEDGGQLRFASDIDDYTGWMLAHALREPALRWEARRPRDFRLAWPGWEPTRYEDKARREGRDSVYLTFERVPRR